MGQPAMDASMHITLPSDLREKLRDDAWKERKTLSALCREILEHGVHEREGRQDVRERTKARA